MSLHLRVWAGVELIGIFFYELVLANLKVAKEVLSPKLSIKPGFMDVPLAVKTDFQITLFSHMITLTPNTLSVELSEDRKNLCVHSLFIKNTAQDSQAIKDAFEKRILQVFEGSEQPVTVKGKKK
ncbi:MAG: Na+/H+ antiporter subunit E [Pseudobdellovibrionaceae bacterium]